MASKRHPLRSVFITLVLLAQAALMLTAQLTVPGNPMGDFRKSSGADAVYLLPPPDPLQIEAGLQSNASDYDKVFQFAIEREVDLSPRYNGVWTTEGNYRVWRIHLISPGAYSLGLVFSEFELRKGVKLMAYDPEMKHVRGAYSALNNKPSGVLAVGHNPGDELILELQVPTSMDDYGKLTLGSVSHAFVNVTDRHASGGCPGSYGCSKDCEIDVNCWEGSEWQNEKHSVIRVSTPTQYCTGVLVNTTAYNGEPLLLTAEHCLDRAWLTTLSVFEFNYESPGCFAGDGSTQMSVSGGDLLAIGDSIDFSLIRLSVTPPDSFKAYYAGWDLSDIQTGGSTTLHHPEGDVKKISFDMEAPSFTSNPGDIPQEFWGYLYDSFWWIRQWDTGSTEPGSSGCPLFNSQHRVIGLLSFGKAQCGDSIGYNADTDRVIFNKNVNIDDYYTKLGIAWDHYAEAAKSLKSWLDPLATGATSIDGRETNIAPPVVTAGDRRYSVFPNPAGQDVYISSPEISRGEVLISVYDLNGRLCMEETAVFPGTVRLRTILLTEGLYLLRIIDNKGEEIHKLVVQ